MPQNKIFKDLVLRRDPVKEYVQLKAGREGLVEARFDLSIHEYRVFFWLLTMIDSSDQELAMHRISIKDIIHTYKLSNTGYHYEHLRQAVLDLKNREFSWQAIIDGKEHILTVPLIDKRAEPRFDEDKTHIWVRLHPDLKPYLLDLKTEYLNINMRYLVNLASPYSIKLYMILKHRLRQNTPFPKYDVGDLRFMLSVPAGTYPKYAEFKNQILIRCMNEINQYTDIRIDDISEIRKGRIVHTVCFTLNAKRSLKAQEKPELLGLATSLEPVIIPEENEDELFKPLKQHKVTKSTFESWINQFGRDQVRVNSQYALKQISYGNIVNTGGYLRRIISDVEIYRQNIEAKDNKKQELTIKQLSNSKVETSVSDFERLMKEKEALMIEYNAKINEATYLLLNDLENADSFFKYVEFQKSIPNSNPFMKIALTAFDKIKVTRETLADVLLNSSGFEEALKRGWLETYFPDIKNRIIQKYKSEAERLGATLY